MNADKKTSLGLLKAGFLIRINLRSSAAKYALRPAIPTSRPGFGEMSRDLAGWITAWRSGDGDRFNLRSCYRGLGNFACRRRAVSESNRRRSYDDRRLCRCSPRGQRPKS